MDGPYKSGLFGLRSSGQTVCRRPHGRIWTANGDIHLTGAVSLTDEGGRSTSVEAFAKPIQNKAVGVLFLPRNLHRGPLFEFIKILIY